MDALRIAAFSYKNKGGNPAGVVIGSEMPSEKEMLETAKQIGYSETAFLKKVDDGWRVRYFAPEMEVEFCGHATTASGAVKPVLEIRNTLRLARVARCCRYARQ